MYNNICYSNSISFTIIKDELFIFEEQNDKIFILKGLKKDCFLSIKDGNFIDSEFYNNTDKKCIEKILNILCKNNIIKMGDI